MASRRAKKRRNRKIRKPPKQRRIPLVDYPMQLPIPAEFKERLLLFNGCETPSSLFKFEPPDHERIWALHQGLAYFASPYDFNDTQDCRLAIDGRLSKEELNLSLSTENRWLTAVAPMPQQTGAIEFVAGANAHLSIAYFKTVTAEYKRGSDRRFHQRLSQLAKIFATLAETGGICCLTDN